MNGRVIALGVLLLAGCVENRAPGNDREADLDPPPAAAEVASAEQALAGVSTSLLKPEIMTDADVGRVESSSRECAYRFTRVGFPVFLYSTSGAGAAIKLNGKLIPLTSAGQGVWTAGGIRTELRLIETDGDATEPRMAEFVLRFAEAENELGFHGFTECG